MAAVLVAGAFVGLGVSRAPMGLGGIHGGVLPGGDPGTTGASDPRADGLNPTFGTCPGAPPSGGGAARHADTAHDARGRLHMVWQERFGGQFDVCYSRQTDANEMGLGADANAAWRITGTPSDSVRPRLAVDPASDILYVVWTELLPPDAMDAESGGRMRTSALSVATTAVFEPNDEPLWTSPAGLGGVLREGVAFAVADSDWTITMLGKPIPGVAGVSNPSPSHGGADPEKADETRKGTFDTDGDGIRDSWEVQGKLGYVTNWWDPDTDGDTLRDLIEITLGYSPLLNDIIAKTKDFTRWVFLYSDADGDGLTLAAEGACDFPVTVGTANVLSGGLVAYRFFPNVTHTASLVLGVQVKRQGILSIPPPTVANYTLNVTADGGPAGTSSFTYSGSSLERDRVTITAGTFPVAVDALTTVTIAPTVEQPSSNGFRTFAIWFAMIAAPVPDYEHFNYKEGRDYDAAGSANAAALTENFDVCGDPNRPDLFLEVDTLVGHAPSPDVYSETINAFSDAGVILHYKLDQAGLALATPTSPDADSDGAETIRNDDEAQDLLGTTRNAAFSEYIHVVFAHKFFVDGVGWVYGGAESADTAGDLTHSGIVFADQELIDTATAASTLAERRIKVLSHELGHTLGASHEGPNGLTPAGAYDPRVDGACCADMFNGYNVMRQGGLTSAAAADMLLRGVGNADRDLGATSAIGKPRFSIESIDQFDLTSKLSVDTGRNIDILDDFV